MQLTDQGVNAKPEALKSALKVPATATAVVASRRRSGEQFITTCARPPRNCAPTTPRRLGDQRDKVTLPAPLEDVVNTALDFAESVPVDDCRRSSRSSARLQRTGRSLTRLVDSAEQPVQGPGTTR